MKRVNGTCSLNRFLIEITLDTYRKIPKFSETRKHCCNLPKIQTKTPNLMKFHQKGANDIANSEDPDPRAD